MKTFTLLLGAAAIALSANAQTAKAPATSLIGPSNALVERVADNHKAPQLVSPERTASNGMMKAPAYNQAPTYDEPFIEETPEGTEKTYIKSGYYYYYGMFVGQGSGSSDGNLLRTVTSPDGKKMYLYGYFSSLNTPGWIVGDIEDDTVTFKFPQLVEPYYNWDDEPEYGYWHYCLALEFVPDEDDPDYGWYYPTTEQEYKFTMEEDGSLTPVDPALQLGMCEWFGDEEEGTDAAWHWQHNGDIYTVLTPNNYVPNVMPEGLEPETWAFVGTDTWRNIRIAFDGDKVYFQDLCNRNGMYDCPVIGTIDGDKIIVENGQYLGEYWYNFTNMFFLTVTRPDADSPFEIVDNITFTYDKENKIIKSEGTYLFSSLKERVYYYNYVEKPKFMIPSDEITVNALQTPINDGFYDIIDPEDGYVYDYGTIYFILQTVDADGQCMKKENLYFEMYVDGEPFVFYPDEYPGVAEDGQTLIPWLFEVEDDPWSIGYYSSGSHYVNFYFQDYENLAVRAVYKNGDNVVESDFLYYKGNESGVNSIDNSEVKSVKYFDLNGLEVSRPEKGIFVRQAIMTDGTVKTQKVVKK